MSEQRSPAPSGVDPTPLAEPEAESAGFTRRTLLQGTVMGVTAAGTLGAPALAKAQAGVAKSALSHYHVAATAKTVHWGYFSKKLPPVVTINPAIS